MKTLPGRACPSEATGQEAIADSALVLVIAKFQTG